MYPFTDEANRRWTLVIDVNAVKRVRKLLDVDLSAPDSGTPALAVRIDTDVVLLCDVLYALLIDDALKLEPPVTDVDFGRTIGAEGLKEGRQALTSELVGFFRKLGRHDLAKVMETQAIVSTKVITRNLSRLERIDVDELINKSERQMSTRNEMLPPAESASRSPSGTASSNSPESSASIPGHSP